MNQAATLLGGIELGGTKCICLVGTGPNDIKARVSIPTGNDPKVTMQQAEEVLRKALAVHGPMAALGIASFGPLDLAPRSSTYGSITSTPKVGWQNTFIRSFFADAFKVPIGFDTDVNGAALAERRWGSARDLKDFAYITVGTGVGVGLMVGGRLACGFTHPELGHIRIARRSGDQFPGSCAFHGDCVEGLASGAAIAARLGRPADQVAADDGVWELVAHALGQLLHTLVLTTAPRRIFVGGGVAEAHPNLLSRMSAHLVESLNGYVALERIGSGGAGSYVVPPGLGSLAGPLGALALAADAVLM